MIGETIYFLNINEDVIKSGLIVGMTVGNEGRLLVNVNSDGQYLAVEESLSYKTEKEATKDMQRVKDLDKEIKAIQKESQEKIDDLRLKILGEAKYKDLLSTPEEQLEAVSEDVSKEELKELLGE